MRKSSIQAKMELLITYINATPVDGSMAMGGYLPSALHVVVDVCLRRDLIIVLELLTSEDRP